MSTRIDPNFSKKLEKYGKAEWSECYHCGNCSAICPLTENGFLFPRKGIRAMQMGLKDQLAGYVDPWLCYYCGECTDTCPRDANPGEMMMTLRRWLTSVYDWTGLSGLLYRSFRAHLTVMILLALGVVAAFLAFADFSIPLSAEGLVQINAFAPAHLIESIDHILLITLSFFLITNMINMFYKVIIKDKSVRVPFYLYFTKVWEAIFHFGTQARFAKCEDKRWYWFLHWFLMSSYVMMFIFIIFFLDWFQTETIHPWYHPQRLLGYYITAGIVFGTVYFVWGRIKAGKTIFKFSHHSDYIFPILLFLIAVTGIAVHIFRLNGMPQATYISYVVHLAVEVPMVVTFVAFSKWSHLAYRPLGLYFANLKKAALQKQYETQLAPAT
jgi:ferredoxin